MRLEKDIDKEMKRLERLNTFSRTITSFWELLGLTPEILREIADSLEAIKESLPLAKTFEKFVLAMADAKHQFEQRIYEDPPVEGTKCNELSHQSVIDFITQMDQIFAALRIQKIPAVGQSFNPEIHQAVGTEKALDPAQHRKITAEIRAGYLWEDQLLRQAQVIVAVYQNSKKGEK